MPVYKYNGPVMLFGRCIASNWKAETTAPTKLKAISNLKYQFEEYAKLNAKNSGIGIINKYVRITEEV